MFKNIWVINHYANSPKDPTTGGMRHFEYCKNIRNFGWDTTIIAASTIHRTELQRISNSESFLDENIDSVQFRWIKARSYSGNSANRVLNMVDFARRILNRRNLSGLPKPSIIWASSPHPFAGFSAYLLSRKYKVPFVYEIRDLWPQTFVDMGALNPNSIQAKLLYRLEKFLCERADLMISLLPNIELYFDKKSVRPKKVLWIPNSYLVQTTSLPNRDNEPGTKFFQYAGSLGDANDVSKLLEGFIEFYKLGNQDYKFRIYGNGPLKPSLNKLIEKAGLPEGTISLNESVPKYKLARILETGFCNVILIKNLDIYKYGVSLNKLLDYFHSGVPVLQIGNPINNDVLFYNAGYSCIAESNQEVAHSLSNFVQLNETNRSRWVKNAFDVLQNRYSLEANSKILSSALTELV